MLIAIQREVMASNDLSESQRNRRHEFCLFLMATLSKNYNQNKFGIVGVYNLGRERSGHYTRVDDDNSVNVYGLEDGEYRGHNIAAMAIYEIDSESPRILEICFNHVKLFDSTSEHAEERLVDRLFQCRGSYNVNDVDRDSFMSKITVISTLEPCFQCSGKLKMSGVREVIYIQTDPEVAYIPAQGFITAPFLRSAYNREMFVYSSRELEFVMGTLFALWTLTLILNTNSLFL